MVSKVGVEVGWAKSPAAALDVYAMAVRDFAHAVRP
jgi:hypothetical protein